MTSIIFSRDRALQLDGLLRLMRQFAPCLWPPKVIWRASNQRYLDGYKILMLDYPDITWTAEGPGGSFQDCLMLELMAPSTGLFTCLLCDDDLFFRPFAGLVTMTPGQTFSLRLGVNTTHCYMADCPQSPGQLDYDYMSVDAHVYRTDGLIRWLETLRFEGPHGLETELNRSRRDRSIFWRRQSCVVGVPNNLVHHSSNRNAGGSAVELNERFLLGDRLDIAAMDFSNVIGAHQEIPFVFQRAERLTVAYS